MLESLKQKSFNYDNFEVLVKFDSDDKKVGKVLPKLDTYPFRIKYLVEPRGRGYLDLHVFYNRLFSLVDERSTVIGAMGDDFEIIQEGWDEIILSKASIFPDQIFIIHGCPHPPPLPDRIIRSRNSIWILILMPLKTFILLMKLHYGVEN